MDSRLRECDYGELTQQKATWNLEDFVEEPYPGGESYRDVEERMRSFLEHLEEKHQGEHIAILAHQAPQLALEVVVNGKTWEESIETDWREVGEWQPSWKYSFQDII